MCENGNFQMVQVTIPADLACDGIKKRKEMQIDFCLAPIIRAFDAAGIETRGCCCGHGKREGNIALQDGRLMLVIPKDSADQEWDPDNWHDLKAEIERLRKLVKEKS